MHQKGTHREMIARDQPTHYETCSKRMRGWGLANGKEGSRGSSLRGNSANVQGRPTELLPIDIQGYSHVLSTVFSLSSTNNLSIELVDEQMRDIFKGKVYELKKYGVSICTRIILKYYEEEQCGKV